MKQSQIIVDGLATRYTRAGHGRTLLLLHGWGDSSATYQGLINHLKDEYDVIAVDLPGFGNTQPPGEAWDLSDYAAWLRAFVSKVSARPYAIIGHSNGGALAVFALGSQLMTAEKLVLLAASGVRNTDGLRRFIIKIIAKVGKTVTFWLPTHARKRLQRMLYGTVGSDMLVAPHMSETFKRTVRHDIQANAKAVMVPTLLLYGSQDTATPVDSVGARLHGHLPHSTLQTIEGAGHFIHHDAEQQVRDELERFLA